MRECVITFPGRDFLDFWFKHVDAFLDEEWCFRNRPLVIFPVGIASYLAFCLDAFGGCLEAQKKWNSSNTIATITTATTTTTTAAAAAAAEATTTK